MNAPIPDVPLLRPRDLFERPGPIPELRLRSLTGTLQPDLVAREPSSSSSESSAATVSCGPNDTSGPCQRSTDATSTSTVPIVIGVVIPVTIALIILAVLTRRHRMIQRKEDKEDKYKSLDFGYDEKLIPQPKKSMKSMRGQKASKNLPEMSAQDLRGVLRKDKGVSLDLLTNPYLLPPELQQSRESLHSLSRNMSHGDDKYRATDFIPDDGSIRSPSVRGRHDDSSSFSASTRRRFDADSKPDALPRPSITESRTNSPAPPAPPAKAMLAPPKVAGMDRNSTVSTASSNGHVAAFRASNNYLGAFISGGLKTEQPKVESKSEETAVATTTVTDLGIASPGNDPQSPPEVVIRHELPARASSVYENRFELPGSESFAQPQTGAELPQLTVTPDTQPISKSPDAFPDFNDFTVEQPRSVESEAPNHHGQEQHMQGRAELSTSGQYTQGRSDNDTSNPTSRGHSAQYTSNPTSRGHSEQYAHQDYSGEYAHSQHQQDQANQYAYGHNNHDQYNQQAFRYSQVYEDGPYNQNHHHPTLPNIQVQQHQDEDAASDYYDEEGFDEYADYMGYNYRGSMLGMRPLPPDDPSENPEQRANRIRSFYKEYFEDPTNLAKRQSYFPDDGGFDDVYGYYENTHPYYRAPSAISDRHRAYSNGSYMSGPRAYSSMSGRYGGPRMKPKKKMPPPKPLQSLPTPHKLKDDDFIPNAIDYAPPQMFKNQRAGTPDSLRGGLRPYSPSVRPHVPLTSSFDDLAVLPSPHQLRKSGLFTALDFAPPGKIKDPGSSMSETGSIRSNRSGISALHQHNIRAGAYRLSRIPKNVAGTKSDMMDALRPTMDITRR